MSSNTLYIPKTITVGFQKRTDTFTGKLAYVIYTDHTGKLRKEGSWNSWRDKTIEPVVVDNVPTPNFTLNKGVQRSRDWFGSGRSMVRVWDPRDFEFEITVDNLLNVLMHADVSKRDITEMCVYAWQGTNLVLLPVNSLDYEQSTKHTAKQSQKFSSKELVIGHSYTVRKENKTVVYLGRLPRYEHKGLYDGDASRYYGMIRGYTSALKKDKVHVFIDPTSKEIFPKDPAAFIAGLADGGDEPHPQLAALFDDYYGTIESQPIAGLKLTTTATNVESWDAYYYHNWIEVSPGLYARLSFTDHTGDVAIDHLARFNENTNEVEMSHKGRHNDGRHYYSSHHPTIAPRRLDGVDPNVGVNLALEVQQTYKQYIADNSNGQRYDQYAHRQLVKALLIQKHHFGKLVPVLKDGKACHNSHY